jgi:hypothetical protein
MSVAILYEIDVKFSLTALIIESGIDTHISRCVR